jgi:ribosomal-protein-alanine N-acetyltransferase
MAAPDDFSVLPIARGPRAHVRAMVSADRDAFLAGVERSRELHADWVAPPRDAAAFDAYVAQRGPTFLGLGVFTNEGDSLVGAVNVSQIFFGLFCNAYLGYYAFTGLERRGLMGEGLDLVLHLMFERVGLHRLEANIQPGNAGSIAMVKNHGFQREGFSPGYLRIAGVWRDHERWAIRREIWSARADVTLEPSAG